MLIGGFAVALQAYARGTKDIDLLIDPSPGNIQRIKKAMSSLPDNAIALIQDYEIQQYQVVRIADEFVVDLMAKACGIDYEAAKSDIDFITVDNVKIPTATKELLIRTKNTIRPSDQMDVNALKQRIEEEKKRK
ncbi:MAG: hypothetical protein A3I05_09315 [Deltaproteobacteria bacterium RIFCSPLOWO2_02_FULL_44_10]|nr:MAG: hypothetical protein A3C46_07665 [Deltaproteobacteria bacterium RIFCSPHIGHO2_02_FULL_44_16]OGQ47441.1 MAG: hypothetical protein A3I05_09315 [Deltaproteobacteria bacterium RIFCSPLOWO2_02_FULL_44_10]